MLTQPVNCASHAFQEKLTSNFKWARRICAAINVIVTARASKCGNHIVCFEARTRDSYHADMREYGGFDVVVAKSRGADRAWLAGCVRSEIQAAILMHF